MRLGVALAGRDGLADVADRDGVGEELALREGLVELDGDVDALADPLGDEEAVPLALADPLGVPLALRLALALALPDALGEGHIRIGGGDGSEQRGFG